VNFKEKLDNVTRYLKRVSREEFTQEETIPIMIVGAVILLGGIAFKSGFVTCLGLIALVAAGASYLEQRDVS
jgi:hypothetical protein